MVKKTLAAALIGLTLLTGCADNKNLPLYDNGAMKQVETYGLFNEGNLRQDCVNYSVSLGNVVLGVLFSYTVIAPIYFFGFSLYEPDSIDHECMRQKIKN